MVAQTTYTRSYEAAFAGMIADNATNRPVTGVNNSGGQLQAGIAVVKSGDQLFINLAAATDLLGGVVINTFARNPGDTSLTLSGQATVAAGDTMNVMEEGAVWILSEQTFAVGDDVYVRYASGSGGSVLGAIRKDTNSTTARQCKGIRVLEASVTGTSSGSSATLTKCMVSVMADNADLA